jgi:hypothetical protein
MEQLLRFSDTGALGKRVATETLLELRRASTFYMPRSALPAVQVLGAFNAGGAGLGGRRESSSVWLTQNFDWGTKRHAFRAGFRLEWEHQTNAEERNAAGTYVFPSLDAYRAQQPSLFTRRIGDPRVSFRSAAGRRLPAGRDQARPQGDALAGRSQRGAERGRRRAAPGTASRNRLVRERPHHAPAGRRHLPRLVRVPGAGRDPAPRRPARAGHRGRAAELPRAADARFPDAHALHRYLEAGSLAQPRIQRLSLGLERTKGEGVRTRFDVSLEQGSLGLRTLNRNAPVTGLGRPDPQRAICSRSSPTVARGASR